MDTLSFPNGVLYYGPSDGKGNTDRFKLTIDGMVYFGQFRNGLYSGSITRPADGDMYGICWRYSNGKLEEKCGIDEDGMLV